MGSRGWSSKHSTGLGSHLQCRFVEGHGLMEHVRCQEGREDGEHLPRPHFAPVDLPKGPRAAWEGGRGEEECWGPSRGPASGRLPGPVRDPGSGKWREQQVWANLSGKARSQRIREAARQRMQYACLAAAASVGTVPHCGGPPRRPRPLPHFSSCTTPWRDPSGVPAAAKGIRAGQMEICLHYTLALD